MATAERLGTTLRDRNIVVGSTRLRGVRAYLDEDSEGETAMFLELTLSDPPSDLETWPVEDIWELRRVVRDAARELELTIPWYLSFVPEHGDPLDPEDAREQLDVE